MFKGWKILRGSVLGALIGATLFAGSAIIFTVLEQRDYSIDLFYGALRLGAIHGLICGGITGCFRLSIITGGLSGLVSLLLLPFLYAAYAAAQFGPAGPDAETNAFQMFIGNLLFWAILCFPFLVPAIVTGGVIGALHDLPENIHLRR